MNDSPGYRFFIVWSGQLLSGLGTGMTGFALGVHLFRETGSAAGFAMVILALFLPSILLKPFGGVLADRLDRRSLIAFGDIGSAAAVLFILLMLRQGDWHPWQIYIAVAVSSACTAVQNPAYKASVTDLVPETQFGKAGGLVQLAGSVQHLIAPVAAGAIYTVAGVQAVLLVDITTFVAAVAAVLAIGGHVPPRRPAAPSRLLPELKAGASVVLANRRVLHTVLVISLVTFFVGILQTLFGPMMLSITDAKTLGFVQSVSASGMLVSSVAIGLRGLPKWEALLLPVSLSAAGLFLTFMGVSGTVPWITITFFLFFVTLPVINTAAELQIRTAVPNEFQGRAWGLIGFLSQLGYVAAYVGAGLLADKLFNPALMPKGALAGSVGSIVGVGPGRGIALMIALSGLGLVLTGGLTFLAERRRPHRLRAISTQVKGV